MDILNEELPSCALNPLSAKTIREFLEVIRVSAIYLTEIIEHMMKFSKQINNPPILEFYGFNTNLFLGEFKKISEAYPRSPNVKLTFYFETNLPEYLYADRSALIQILLSILSNALKFTEYGIVHFSVRSDGSNITFSCQDTGSGMSEQFIQNRLFTPFSQENASLGSKPRGLGLGLALSKNLIEQMKGKIHINSKKGEGTNVCVSLPVSVPVGSMMREENLNILRSNSTLVDLLHSHQPHIPSELNFSPDFVASMNQIYNDNSSGIDFEAPYFSSSYPLDLNPPLESSRSISPSNVIQFDPIQLESVPEEVLSEPIKSNLLQETKFCALVVDDTSMNRQILVRLLSKNNFDTLEASTGSQALQLISENKNKIHVILLVINFF